MKVRTLWLAVTCLLWAMWGCGRPEPSVAAETNPDQRVKEIYAQHGRDFDSLPNEDKDFLLQISGGDMRAAQERYAQAGQ